MLRIDPETSLGLLLRLGGAGAFLLLAAGITGSLLVILSGLVRGNPRWTRRAALVGASLLAVYGGLLIAGPVLLGRRTLRPGEEVTWRHQHARHAAENRLQQPANQAHVMVQRQPADDHVIGVEVDAEAMTDQLFVGHQVAMADLHAFGQRGGT